MFSRKKKKNNTVNELTFRNWEKDIITSFNNISLIPTNGNPVYAIRDKVILVLDFETSDKKRMSELVQNNVVEKIPAKIKIPLYHFGNLVNDAVSVGIEDTLFKYPCTDFGGLTNYYHTIGEKVTFLKDNNSEEDIIIDKDTDCNVIAPRIHELWKKHAKKETIYVDNFLDKINTFLNSVKAFLKSDDAQKLEFEKVYICFARLLPEARILYKASDIQKHYKKYYIRTFKRHSDVDNYADKISSSQQKNVYLSIASNALNGTEYITPNLNKENILNEYRKFDLKEFTNLLKVSLE